MADKNIKIGVQVTDGGSAGQTTKNVKNVKDVLDQTTASANNATKAITAMNTAQAGGRATTAKIKQATSDERGMYAAQRGAAGTGAASRDFSKESQGLGGVVRLYATFAANIFAVGAAFNALSQAMDTANMVKGLDQLGAAQGRNLGSLAKQLSIVTDGALSLRESLTAVAQTSASGMTNANILKLGEVAKKASQALGVNLPDAVSRLSRGITKLEPELLDELGIFTKIEKATEDYARTIGKSAGALTDFERRQAFANAVLEEGNKKFSAINIDVNPYAQLAASFKNAVDSGLNLVNKVLTPIVSLLASNPTALAAVLGTIAVSLIKQAIPALGAFKANLDKTAIMAADNAKALAKKAEQASLEEVARARKTATEKADIEYNKTEEALARIDKLKKAAATEGIGKGARAILGKIPQEITDEDFQTLKKTEQGLRNFKKQAAADALKEGIETAKASKKSIELEAAAIQKYQQRELQNAKALSNVSIQREIARKAEINATGLMIRARASENLQVLGLINSYRLLKTEILAAQAAGTLDKTGAAWTKFSGTLGLVAGKAASLAQAFSQFFIYIGLAVAAFEIFDKLVSTSAKEATAFSGSIDTLDSSLENVTRTIDTIYNKPLAEAFSIEAIQARANALVDLSQSLDVMAGAFDKLIKAQGDWDRGWDTLKDVFGMSAGDKLAENLAGSVVSSLDLIREGPAKEAAKKAFQEIYGVKVDLTSIKSMTDAVDALTRPEQAQKAKELASRIREISISQANQASTLTTLKTGLEETGKLVDTFNNSLKATDNFSKIGNQLLVNYRDLSLSLKDGTNNLAAMNAVVNDTKLISLLPPDIAASIVSLKDQVNDLYKDAGENEAKLAQTTKDYQKAIIDFNTLQAQEEKPLKEIPKLLLTGAQQAAIAAVEIADAEKSALESRKKSIEATKQSLDSKFKEINSSMFDAGIKKLEQGLKGAFAEAGIIAAKGYVSIIQAAGGNTADLENKLQQEEIAIQMQNVNALYENSRNLKELSAQIEFNTAVNDMLATQGQLAGRELLPPEVVKELEKKLVTLTKEIPKLAAAKNFYAAPSIEKLKGLQGAAEGSAEREAARQIGASGFASEMFGKEGAMAKLNAQLGVLKLTKEIVNPQKEITRLETISLNTREAINSRALEQAKIEQDIVGVYSESLSSKRNSLELEDLSIKRSRELLKTTEEINIATAVKEKAGISAEAKKAAELALSEAQDRRQQIELKYIYDIDKTKRAQVIAALDGIEKQRQAEVSRQNTVLGFIKSEADARLALQEQELNLLNARGSVSETYLINANAQIAAKRQDLQLAQELKAVEDAKLAVQIDFENKRKKLPATVLAPEVGMVQDPAAIADLNSQQANALDMLNRQSESIKTINGLKTQGNGLAKIAQLETAENNKRLEEQAIAMEKIQSIAKDLGTVFGEFGKAIGTGLEGVLKATQDFDNKRRDADKKYAKDRLALEKSQAEETASIYAEGVDPELLSEQVVKSKQDQTKASLKLDSDYALKSKNLEMDKNIAIVSSAKSMFKEKTGAYKVLSAVEKAMTVAKLAMNAQQMISDGILTAKSIANTMQRAFADGQGAVVKAYNSIPFPFNIAAAATVAALVAAVIGKSVGGGGGGGGFTATSEQKQKVAGTGQMYDDSGKLVSRAGGVPTDDTARAESVEKSLRYMQENMSETTKLSNKMLEALKAIKDNTEGLASALLTTFRAPNAGNFSQFGQTGTLKQGYGERGGTSALLGGAVGAGAAVALAAAGTGAALMGFATAATLLGPVGLLVGVLASQIPVVGKAISSIFGGKTTRDITDFGIAVKGTVKEIALGAEETIQQFADVQTKRKGGWFRKDRVTNETLLEEANNQIKGYVSSIFTGAQKALKESSKILGRDTALTGAIIDATQVAFKLSAKGISGEELAKAIEGEISIAVNEAAAAAFPEFEKFAKPFEEAGQTVLRLATNAVVLKDSLANLSIVLPQVAEGVYSAVTPKMQEDLSKVLQAKDTAQAEFDRISAGVGKTITETMSTGEGSVGGYGEYTQEVTRTIATAEDATKAQATLTAAIGEYDKQAAIVAQAQNTRTAFNIENQEKLIDLNDDIDTLNKRLIAYGSSILTTGQRTAAMQTKYLSLVDELDVSTGGALKSALANVKNKGEFDDLFKASLAANTDAGRVMATALLKLTPLYATTTDALEKYTTALEDQKIKMGALGIAGGITPDQAKTVQRGRERTKITEEYTGPQAALLIANQEAIWQKEDEIETTKRSITLLQAQGRSHDALIKSRELELIGMDSLTAANKIAVNQAVDANKTRDLEIELAGAQGNAQVVLNHTRSKELDALSASDRAIKQATFAQQDANKTRDLEIELAAAQGNAQVALNHTRSKELAALSETDRAVKQATFAQQDANKTRDLEMDLAKLQGNAQVALNHSRSKELDLLSAGDRAIKETIFAEQDRLDLRSREISLMSAQGYTYAAMLEQRKLDLKLLTTEQQTKQLAIYAQEDINKTESLNIQLMEASGDTLGTLYANRVKELKAMSESDQAIQIRIWALQDEAKINDLNIELMEASGDAAGALYARRTQELKGMSRSAQELKRRIWLLEDEKKILASKNAQEIKIYELLGKSGEALRLQREAELEATDAALRPGQLYIYALEDQKTAYEKLKTAAENTTSTLKSSIQTLKDYQASLKTGDKSILKPAEIYAIRKQEFFNLKAIAEAVAVTPAELAAQETAISKLPAAADAFLDSSKTLFASGQAYTDDFNLIDSILTSLTTTLTGQLSDAEKALNEQKAANAFLETINDSSKTTAQLMADLVTATNNVAAAQAAAAAAGYASAGGVTTNFNAGVNIPDIQTVSSTIPGIQTAPILPELTPLSVPAVAPAPATATAPTTATAAMEAAIATAPAAVAGTEPPPTTAIEITRSWYENHPLTTKDPRAQEAGALWWAQFLEPPYSQDLSTLKETFSKRVSEELNLNYVVDRFARGGLASGLAMVGEEGPELVDFQTPGRVYPAGQTTAMLANNTALVNEIKALRQEVEKLRSEQKEQTGHLITTNYDATRIAAEMLAKATEESSKEAAWANRSAARVV